MNANVRTLVYSFLCVIAIGYLFGVVFAVRAIGMSQLESQLGEMLVLTGWVGLTFAVLFVPIGLVALLLLTALRQIYPRPLSRWMRIYLLAWFVISAAISIPFLGYYYSSGIDPDAIAGANSPWDLMPTWLLQVGRWIGFSLLTGNLLALAATETLIRYFGIRETPANRSLWSRRLLIGVPVLVLLVWLLPPVVLKLTRGPEVEVADRQTGVEASEIVPDPALAPVVIVGWDGVTWDVVDPLLAQGKMPNLASLIDHGLRAPLTSFEPTSSPLIWTTISTGRPPGQHGVRSQVENRFRGMRRWFFFPPSMGFDRIFGRAWERMGIVDRVTITSDSRRSKAFWNILSEEGRRVGLVNWRVAWPAEPVNGFNITDHLHPSLVRLTEKHGGLPEDITARDLAAMMPGAIAPPTDVSLLESSLEEGRDLNRRYAEETGLPLSLAPESETFAAVLGMEMARRESLDVLGLYFYRLDGIEHQYWKYREPQYFFSAGDETPYDQAIDQIHVFSDRLLGDILRSVPEDAIVILLSDHGHGPVFGEFRRSGGHSHAPPGILVMAGPGIKSGAALADPTVYDVFPTLMYMCGLPVEGEVRGRVLLEAFSDSVRATRPVRSIERYAPRDIEVRRREQSSPVDRELLDRLKQLGYIG